MRGRTANHLLTNASHSACMRGALAVAIAFLLSTSAVSAPARPLADCTRTSTGLVPLTELRTKRYHGYQGGLYPNGANSPPTQYLKNGLAAAKRVTGRVVLLSIGMSNTTQEFQAFTALARTHPNLNPNLTIVDGAQGGQDAVRISDPNAPFWARVDGRLAQVGATRADVRVVWLKEAIARPTEPFPADAKRLHAHLRQIVRILDERFRNLRIVYVSSRTYGGYASTPLNPEPYAYQSAFAVKWLVADRIAGRIKGPWVGWGPYLWADGTRARADGLAWSCSDFREDGTHPSDAGRRKVAERLMRFFTTNRTAKPWFVR